jgi:Microtubule associated protein (MAP65/ASE1 family)
MQVKLDRFNKISNLRREIESLIAIFSRASLCGNITALNDEKPTISNIESLECLRDDLISHYEELRRNISEARDRLKLLFSELNVNVTDDTKFLLEGDKISEALHQKLNDEINFLEAEHKVKLHKREKVKELLDNWTFNQLSAVKIRQDVNETEFRDFENFCDINKNIFALMEKRRSLWNRIETLQRFEGDPSRLKNRGGKLLKEEHERKLIAKQLPSIEAKLSQMIHQYEIEVEKKNNRKFTLFGEKVEIINRRFSIDYQSMRENLSPAQPKVESKRGIKKSSFQHIVEFSKRFNPLRY